MTTSSFTECLGRMPQKPYLVLSFFDSAGLQPETHLVIVRYGANHDTDAKLVYNAAHIDSAKFVWAREMGPDQDRELLNYFKGRRIWLLEPDLSLRG